MEKTTLADLNVLDKGEILGITAKGEIRRRLMDMGLIRGTSFKILRVAPLGDPIEIFFKGFHLSLRKEEAAQIVVCRIGAITDGESMGRKNKGLYNE